MQGLQDVLLLVRQGIELGIEIRRLRRQGDVEDLSVFHVSLADDGGQEGPDGVLQRTAVVVGHPGGQFQEVWRQLPVALVQPGDGADAGLVGIFLQAQDVPWLLVGAEGRNDAAARLHLGGNLWRNLVVEDLVQGQVKDDFGVDVRGKWHGWRERIVGTGRRVDSKIK